MRRDRERFNPRHAGSRNPREGATHLSGVMAELSAVISFDNRRRVKYKSWLGTESFYKGDATVMFFHVEPGNPYSVKREFLSVTNMGNHRVGYTLTDVTSGRSWIGNLGSWEQLKITGGFLRDVAIEDLRLVVR